MDISYRTDHGSLEVTPTGKLTAQLNLFNVNYANLRNISLTHTVIMDKQEAM